MTLSELQHEAADRLKAVLAEIESTQKTLATLQPEAEALRAFVATTKRVKRLHWTQRPENARKVHKIVAAAQAAAHRRAR